MQKDAILTGISKRLREAYWQDGRNLSEIAREANVARTTMYRIFNGDMTMSVVLLANLCKALDVSADWILYGKE